ncbi:hypothetical protein NQZ68_009092 [Dissostichus eleginoides]|nr:hypothetical protein NQZ68_009092 [Dissostichus eleginoides]
MTTGSMATQIPMVLNNKGGWMKEEEERVGGRKGTVAILASIVPRCGLFENEDKWEVEQEAAEQTEEQIWRVWSSHRAPGELGSLASPAVAVGDDPGAADWVWESKQWDDGNSQCEGQRCASVARAARLPSPSEDSEDGRLCAVYTVNGPELCTTFITAVSQRH